MSHKQAKRLRGIDKVNYRIANGLPAKQPKKEGPDWRESLIWRLWIATCGEPKV